MNAHRILIAGILLIAGGVWLSIDVFSGPTYWTKVDGTVDTVFTSTETVENERSRYGITTKSESRRSTLTLQLHYDPRKYTLIANIGDDIIDFRHAQIRDDLKKANKVNIWISTSDTTISHPKIWQIAADEKIILPGSEIRTKNLWMGLFILGLGILSIVIWRWAINVRKSKRS